MRTLLTLALTISIAWMKTASAAEPAAYLGRASCASATCHGGIPSHGPAWNSSLRNWESQDAYHSGAGQTLLNEQSIEIVSRLLTHSLDTGNVSEDLFLSTLQDRCVSCHAPSAHTASNDIRRKIAEGVSCEACHGPASNWVSSHVLADVNVGRLRDEGMLQTANWADRVDNCARCHVGSRTADGIVRDMNHDMIAAGHPALWFDASQYHLELPTHWEIPPSKAVSNSKFLTEVASATEHIEARSHVLNAVIELSSERRRDHDARTPLPEFSEYDCRACHQPVSNGSEASINQNGAAWNHFYTEQVVLDEFPLGDQKFFSGLSGALIPVSNIAGFDSPLEFLQQVANRSISRNARVDRTLATLWLWENRLGIINASRGVRSRPQNQEMLNDQLASELVDLLDRFGRELYQVGPPSQRFNYLPPQLGMDMQGFRPKEILRLHDSFLQKLDSDIRFEDSTPPKAGQ